MMKVAKFGGSSVSGPGQFKKVKAIMLSDPQRRVAVISAAGKRNPNDHKLTDLLYLCHAHMVYGVNCDDILASIEERFLTIRDSLKLTLDLENEFSALRFRLDKGISVDELVSRGEYFTARLMAEYLGFFFVDAADCIFFGFDGQIDRPKTEESLRKALKDHEKIVLPGFYGRLPSGKIKIMQRGGGDITGALAAAALDADVYENWTDVPGILMADPKIVENPKAIARLTYAELQELAFMGASVLKGESILPVKEKGIPINIRNTNRPGDPGTMILEKIEETNGANRPITGITGRKNFDIITVSKRNIPLTETLRQTLEVFGRYQVPIEQINLGLDSFALVASADALGDRLYDLVAELKKVCRPDSIHVQDDLALVAAVGRKMIFRPGTSGRLFQALGEKGVNIRMITQGADELSIILGVENGQFETAVKILYEGFTG